MRRWLIALLFGLVGASAITQTPGQTPAQTPIVLRDMGSFHVGGRVVEIRGKPAREVNLPDGSTQKVDPNGRYLVEQMYVQYFLPQNRRGKVPLLMWHGGGLTGVTYETTPDGREGWLNMFVRKGFDVYVSDAVERGRAGWASSDVFAGEPVFTPLDAPWEAYRFGEAGSWNDDPAQRKPFPGTQFPPEAYETLLKQIVPRWITTNEAIMAAYLELIDKVGPCVLVVHSQSGTFGYRAALARPDKVRALVDIEGTLRGDAATAAALKHIPILVLYGDNVDKSPMFSNQRKINQEMAQLHKAAGGSIDIVNLPEVGLPGNTHFLMMEKNNGKIADLIEAWLARKGLVD